MKILDHLKALEELCRLSGKPGIYLRLPGSGFGPLETQRAVPWLDLNGTRSEVGKDYQVLLDEHAWVICEDQAECERLYEQVVGDDGPTESNPYSGPARVYAVTCDASGQIQRENT